ncbi:Endonuclease/exonuclease/phosphatase [Rhodocollybia butyracea]|uniref:DNA-(apurinic or apyrimidinic site) endonuclease n=1 Tax=Rhodocollybia butyracea TaxID=206335 RepID=A0A9P5Q682_9AGAR|nr:Endonuclease/exonuclease/phosphatase [Rhodocollybia butyracea]
MLRFAFHPVPHLRPVFFAGPKHVYTMPPKRTNSSKRKLVSDSEDDNTNAAAASSSSNKKAKVSPSNTSENLLSSNGQPTNKVLPVNISFPARIPGTIRMATFNVCGLAASQKKGFSSYVAAEDPDILVLTETKVNNEPVDLALKNRFPHCYWSIAEKKGYSGTAILSKHKALSVDRTLPGHPNPSLVKGRIVTLEFENHYVIGTYVPNAGTELKTLSDKNEWNVHFTKYIRDLDKLKPVIWTGDLNVAPTEIDLSNAKKNWNKTPGYTEDETTAYRNILNAESVADVPKFADIWREFHPEDKHFTYFSYRFNCRQKGIGWRLDMFVLSERIRDRVKMCEIRSEIYGASDHCPLTMEIEGPL